LRPAAVRQPGRATTLPEAALFAIPYDPNTNPPKGAVTNGNSTYLVKWLDRESRFAELPAATCSNAGSSTSHATLPDANALQDPTHPSSSV
jgi:hypothetical protein